MDRCHEIFDRLKREGISAALEFIADRQSEELFLDFKRSSDDGAKPNLSQIDRNNLAKAISGFGNSAGGVIVWGIDCSKDIDGADVAKAIVPIVNPERYVGLLQHAVSGCTVPPHTGVEITHVPVSEGTGIVVVLIPKSELAPHQALSNKHYYIRAGSDFVPTPHEVLAGMFGRRPQPDVFVHFILTPGKIELEALRLTIGVTIYNKGPGIARDVYLIADSNGAPGANCQLRFDVPDKGRWSGSWEFGHKVSMIAMPDYRLPPGANTKPLNVILELLPPFTSDFIIEGRVGASEAPAMSYRISSSTSQMSQGYDAYLKRVGAGPLRQEDLEQIIGSLLTTEQD